MLILSRKKNERTIISIDGVPICKVTVTGIRGDKIRLGFEARKDLSIDREEVFIDKYHQKEKA